MDTPDVPADGIQSDRTLRRQPEPQFRWIEDHGLLRDEGVIVGLKDSDGTAVAHKIECIQRYYQEKAVRARNDRTALEREISELESDRSTLESDGESLEAAIEDSWRPFVSDARGLPRIEPHLLVRYSLGGILAVATCGLNYVLILGLLEPHFENPILVAAGVLLAGLFTLSQPASVLFVNRSEVDGEKNPEGWKQWFLEIAPPVVAALFVTVWSIPELGIVHASIVFMFILTLFLAGGKLILTSLSMLPLLMVPVRKRRHATSEHKKLLSRMAEMTERIESLRSEHRRTDDPEAWLKRGEAAEHLFLSEYSLAKSIVGASTKIMVTESQNDGGLDEPPF